MTKKARKIWWASWPGALALGVVSFLMVAATAIPLVAVATLSAGDVSGTDMTSTSDSGAGWRLGYIFLGAVVLVLPVAVVWVARRKWLGWMLALLASSAVVFGAGLVALGIL